MVDWSKLVRENYERAHRDDSNVLVTNPPATTEELDDIEKKFGFKLPSEFRELYSTFNGIGVAHEEDPDSVWWLFHETQEIGQFCNGVREWFRNTHEEYANRFFPFIDFANGDGIGYVLDESGELIEGLCSFNHEAYRFDPEQDVNEFLAVYPVTIAEFLQNI